MKSFPQLVLKAVQEGYSDLHVTGGQPLVYRKNGVVQFDRGLSWSAVEVDDLVRSLLNPPQMEMLRRRFSVDFVVSVQHVRARINAFVTMRGLSMAVRLLPGSVPTIEQLNLHPSLKQICELPAGLVLLCGTTGCGKSTTIAAIVDEINRSRPAHIVTLEDPVEYRFSSKQSLIEQRELGTHMPSFHRGLLDVLREDPDVIVVGELREPETIRLTLDAAESGHLVLASLHATHAEDAVYRISNAFPQENQGEIRYQLASTLSWLIIQRLVHLDRLTFRVPLLSILRGTQSVKGMIRENRLPLLENAIQTGKGEGMFSAERYLKEYLNLRDAFVHPSFSFRPSTETVADPVHESPLLRGALGAVAAPVSAGDGRNVAAGLRDNARREAPPPVPGGGADRFDARHLIEEADNLGELLSKMERKRPAGGDPR